MKIQECDIVKDLLPSYIDDILSTSTKEFVEKHLEKCKDCKEELENMKNDMNVSEIINQEEQIDYLKGYKKSKTKAVVNAILVTIIIILVLLNCYLIAAVAMENYTDRKFLIDLDEVYIESYTENDEVCFYFSDEKYTIVYDVSETYDDSGLKTININLKGCYVLPWEEADGQTITLDMTNVDKIYMTNLEDDVKEIWSKE